MGYCVNPNASIDADVPLFDADPDQPDAGCDQGPTPDFSDDFDDNSINARWEVTDIGPVTASEANGRVEFAFPSNSQNDEAEFSTLDPTLNMSGKRIFVEVPQTLVDDSRTRVRLRFGSAGNIQIQQLGGELVARYSDGNGDNSGTPVPYDSVMHRWWQFRDTGAQLVFETAPDGRNWTPLESIPTPDGLDNAQVQLYAETFSPVVAPGAAYFDNLNVLPGCP